MENIPSNECPEDVVVMTESATEWPFNPIKILEQNNSTVTFSVINPFNTTITALYYQYAAAETGETKCYGDNDLFPCEETLTITAHCLTHPTYSLAVVDVWIVDPESIDPLDNETVPECCEPDEDDASSATVLWSFKVYCETHCPDRRARKLGAAYFKSHANNELKKSAQSDGAVLEPSTERSPGHFCSSEDYPCGDDSNLVHVCHYSAKDGYQTYCVPESDSDVVAYFPKDYCGPCVGGYGALQ